MDNTKPLQDSSHNAQNCEKEGSTEQNNNVTMLNQELQCLHVTKPNGVNENDQNEITSKHKTTKRESYLEWSDYFMAVAFLSAQRSKDPRTQVGACIVNCEKKIVGIGYNGMPNGCHDDLMPWGKEADDILDTKKLYVCHAELNAVLNKNSADVKDCTIYVALFPCNECAKIVIQSGIKEVVYYSDKYSHQPSFKASKRMLDLAGVKYRQYTPNQKKIVIDFSVIDRLSGIQLNDEEQK